MDYKSTILAPHMSEKSYGLAQSSHVYTFRVPVGSNKHSLARAIESQFSVTVIKVNISKSAGKVKRTASLSGRRTSNRSGKRSDFSKAYVTLKKGDSLPIFAAVEEAEAKEQATQEKIDKVAAKQAEKESKPTRRGIRRTKKEREDA